MKTALITCLLAFLVLSGTQKVEAAELTIEQVAEDYISTYPIKDMEKTLSFYTDETVWQDPRFAPGQKFIGQDVIRGMMTEFAENKSIKAFSYEPTIDYIVGDFVIYKYTMGITLEVDGKMLQAEGVEGIAIARIVDGKVLEHTDFTNVDMFNKNLMEVK